MSSPQHNVAYRRKGDSQESKVTSTPQRERSYSPSLSLSSIHSETSLLSVATVISCGAESDPNEVQELEGTSSKSETFIESSNASTILKIKKSGRIWNIYKPRNADTLYYVILLNPSSSQDAAVELLSKYHTHPKFVIMSILQLFIDVSGYQRLKINEVYTYEECNTKIAIHYLQNQVLDPELMKIESFLMQETRGENVIVIKEALNKFLQKLILAAHHMEILYDNLFAVHIFEFIRHMAFSMIRPLRHTGIVFALKLMTACAIIYSQISQQLACLTRRSIDDIDDAVRKTKQKQSLLKYIGFFYLIFSKNCLIPDAKSYVVRIECVKEITQWIKYIPEYVLLEMNCVNLLIKLIQDQSKQVRLAAVETSAYLVFSVIHNEDMKCSILALLEIMGKRVLDVDYEVAIRTCVIFTKLLEKFPALVKEKTFKVILPLMYHKEYKLAKSAAVFITTFIRIDSSDTKGLLLHIARISGLSVFTGKLPLLIESLLECTPELQNWEAFLCILLDNSISFPLRKILLQMFCVTIQQLFSKSTLVRNKSKAIFDDKTKLFNANVSIIQVVIPNISDLVGTYEEDNDCIVYILKAVASIDYGTGTSNLHVYYNEIFKMLQKMLLETLNEDIIEHIVQSLCCFCDKLIDYKNRALAHMKNIADRLVKQYLNLKNQVNVEYMEEVESLNVTIFKLSKLFECYDLTKLITWGNIYETLSFDITEISGNCIVCLKHFLIWSLKNIMDKNQVTKDPKLMHQLNELSFHCKEFRKICFDVLEKNIGSSVEFMAFDSTCDLLFVYHSSLEVQIKFNYDFNHLHITIDEEQCKLLMKFFEVQILENVKVPLEKQQKYLAKIMDLIMVKILPLTALSKVFLIYAKHHENFHAVLDDVIEQVLEIEKAPVALVLYALEANYHDMLHIRDQVDVNSSEFKVLCILAKKLASFRKVKMNMKEIVRLAIKYVFRDKVNYQFLYLLKYFVQPLPDTDKAEFLKRFQAYVPAADRKDDAILFFSTILKGIIVKKVNKNESKGKQQAKKADNCQDKSLQVKRKINQSLNFESSTSGNFSVHDESSDDLDISDSST